MFLAVLGTDRLEKMDPFRDNLQHVFRLLSDQLTKFTRHWLAGAAWTRRHSLP